VTKRVFLVAAEPSGDQLGREVAVSLRERSSDISLGGIGGREMSEVGLTSNIDTSPLSVLGLFEGLKAYPRVVKLADAAADEIIAFNPDAAVLIDSWGFMSRVAQRLRKRAPQIQLIKLIGPQVWATRAGRAKTLAASVDHLLAMFEMEVPYYEPFGLKTTVIGSPALGRTKKGDRHAFRKKYNINPDREVLLILPGSRPGEIKRVAPEIIKTTQLVKKSRPETEIVITPAHSVVGLFNEIFPEAPQFSKVLIDADDRYDAMAAADLAIACSGTVTTELAMQGTPFLVGYKLGWMTWAIARSLLYKPDYMTILNIAANSEVAPEYLQTKFKADVMADKALKLLGDAKARTEQVNQQNAALRLLVTEKPPAADLAADAILSGL